MSGPTPSRLISRERCALVVIDVQEKLLPVMAEKDLVRDNCVRLATFARRIGLPVLVTEQEKLGPTVADVAAAMGEFDPVPKISFDCFGEEAFRSRMEALGRSTLILAGIESHICVAQTALSALDRYAVHVVDDAVSSRALNNKAVALRRLVHSGAVITSAEMVIYELLGRAGTDEFKAALKLVK